MFPPSPPRFLAFYLYSYFSCTRGSNLVDAEISLFSIILFRQQKTEASPLKWHTTCDKTTKAVKLQNESTEHCRSYRHSELQLVFSHNVLFHFFKFVQVPVGRNVSTREPSMPAARQLDAYGSAEAWVIDTYYENELAKPDNEG